jgi:hypothetical protein
MIINLAELQRTYRAQLNSERRDALRRYLLDGDDPPAAIFILVSRRLYADGQIDNLGLASVDRKRNDSRTRCIVHCNLNRVVRGSAATNPQRR